MTKHRELGLDELMIVNPSPEGAEALFLGEDGTLYRLQGPGEDPARQGEGQFFLGEDGTLYQVQGFNPGGPPEPGARPSAGLGEDESPALGRYFLGADGVLYEVVR